MPTFGCVVIVGRSTVGMFIGTSSSPVFRRSLGSAVDCFWGVQIRLGVSGYQSGGRAGVPIALGALATVGGGSLKSIPGAIEGVPGAIEGVP